MNAAYIFLAALVFLMYGLTLWSSSQEGFENEGSVTYEDPEEIYDDIYASIYDLLWNPQDMLKYEQVSMQDISLADWNTKNVHVLDMACGTAPHSGWFKELNVDYTGVDISDSMLKKARENTPNATFQKGDITQVHLYPQKSMTHCVLTGFSIYQFKNPKLLFNNINSWMKPGGILVVHLVHPEKFDPILDAASPFAGFSLQKYSKERITDSEIKFDKFSYKSKFVKDPQEKEATFEEIIEYKEPKNGKKYREHKQRLFMPSLEEMLDIIRSAGFTKHEMVDMVSAGFEYQYLVFFTK
jgi:ubiquinone/menaquinone biosynthesis C-methylase UbiE